MLLGCNMWPFLVALRATRVISNAGTESHSVCRSASTIRSAKVEETPVSDIKSRVNDSWKRSSFRADNLGTVAIALVNSPATDSTYSTRTCDADDNFDVDLRDLATGPSWSRARSPHAGSFGLTGMLSLLPGRTAADPLSLKTRACSCL
ncbi:MAG: hypothetical protein RIS70_1252 [Planctomycetota bacterium]